MLCCFSNKQGCLYHFTINKENFEASKLHDPQKLYRYARIHYLFKDVVEIAVFDYIKEKPVRKFHFFANKDFKEEEMLDLIKNSFYPGGKSDVNSSNTNSSISANNNHNSNTP